MAAGYHLGPVMPSSADGAPIVSDKMATLFQIFRVLCDVSVMVIYQGSALRGGIWRLKLVLLYCFAVSSLTVGGFILKLAIDLSLHWNPQFYLDPIPFHLTFASSFFIGMQGNE